ncbi:MAG: serine hydrolase [Anaerolineaceae bacterium]|nr:serine hydrolase [Anaerolineaceae bacterium]
MSENEIIETIDQMLQEQFPADQPGAAVIITKNGEMFFRKGYGLANLEHNIPIEPHMVFRLGSITKQFTAVAILMLYEEGKLDLQDCITKYLQDYPTHGHTITIEHLLTHTSGIKSYTNLASWMEYIRNDMTVDAMIDKFKNEPMEFAPGDRFNYNNSGYFLLGAIVEKISGITYEDFLQTRIFDVLDMKNTYYDMPDKIIPARVSGYKKVEDGFQNADFISMTHPYAAGSLASTVDDLAVWDEALYTEKLLKQDTIQKAFTPFVLNDGESCGYAFGWAAANFQNTKLIMHGGGIPGFITDGLRFPDDHVYVSILNNRGEANPDLLAYKIGSLSVGRSYQQPQGVELDKNIIRKAAGKFNLDMIGFEFEITFKDGKLEGKIPVTDSTEIIPVSETEFIFKDSPYQIVFEKNEAGVLHKGKLVGFYDRGMRFSRLNMEGEKTQTISDPSQYPGNYEIAEGVKAAVKMDIALSIQIPGQPKVELENEGLDTYAAKGLPVKVTFERDEKGVVQSLTIDQAGQKVPAKKVE